MNQYERVVKSFITKEEISAKTGLLTWDLKNLEMLSTGEYAEDGAKKHDRLHLPARVRRLGQCCFASYIRKKMERRFVLR